MRVWVQVLVVLILMAPQLSLAESEPVTLYGHGLCPDCVRLKNTLKSRGIEVRSKNLTDPSVRREYHSKYGKGKIPLAVVMGKTFRGYQPEKIASLVRMKDSHLEARTRTLDVPAHVPQEPIDSAGPATKNEGFENPAVPDTQAGSDRIPAPAEQPSEGSVYYEVSRKYWADYGAPFERDVLDAQLTLKGITGEKAESIRSEFRLYVYDCISKALKLAAIEPEIWQHLAGTSSGSGLSMDSLAEADQKAFAAVEKCGKGAEAEAKANSILEG